MLSFLLKKIIGTKNERELKRLVPIVARINELEPALKLLSDDDLRRKTTLFRERVAQGESIEDLLPEAFATVREASIRVLGMRHFDAQLIGGMVLHRGLIAEMKTGEGKTLVATLPVYLNALLGKGVHVITVNDYLARRDAEWMGKLYRFLGLTVGVIIHGLNDDERKVSYGADVTYGTNNEFGFDYLRDNMKFDPASFVQRPLHYAIVDEVDSILIDEARTPLIISGPAEESTELYGILDGIIPYLKKEKHYTVDEKARAVMLTEEGALEVEGRLNIKNLYDPANINYLHHVNQALRAHVLYTRDVDYVVKDGKVIIVDEFTGRLMPGRRWSDGLHQAVEAKERIRIENENQTLATITFQNFFRMYKKLAGMTGTADTEAPEFAKIYNLDVRVIPTHRAMIRKDLADVIYKTHEAKFEAVIADVRQRHEKGQPVLVGTISIEKSERLSKMLDRYGVAHHVLNAKQHDREAEIVAQAGRKGAVTISTNMAGRGTDILLGGNPAFLARAKVGAEAPDDEYAKELERCRTLCAAEHDDVVSVGGLHIMGTERHESRRIDNQLRGRSGRQGDPGSSQFFLSLEDDLLRIFGGERIQRIMERMGMRDDEEIQHPWLTRAIANAQRRVEGHNFEIRKNLLEFDDVMNQQRTTVYGKRRQILAGENNRDLVLDMIDQMVTEIVDESIPERIPDDYDSKEFEERVRIRFNVAFRFADISGEKRSQDGVGEILYARAVAAYEEREQKNGPDIMRQVERILMLQTLDALWKDHLLQMDHLKEGIGLRGYGQKDPLLEYKKEGFMLFREMMDRFTAEAIEKLFRVEVTSQTSLEKARELRRPAPMATPVAHRPPPSAFATGPAGGVNRPQTQAKPGTVVHTDPRVGRNDPCPCGARKEDGRPMKYKHCHGRDA